MKYLGRKYNLFPQTEEEMQRCDVAQGVVEDFRYKFINFSYYATDATFDKLKTAFEATFKAYMDRFEAYLTKHKWLAGDTLTYVDFGLFEAMDQIRVFDSKLFNDHPKVIQYLKEINDFKGVSEYRSSDRFRVFPINSKYAYWGGQSS
uniref:glutathione transferase n=1 Tax=Ciona savignyi TaxID=51511 RepID=H2ZHU3_CIOSA